MRSAALPGWAALTLGRPAALTEPPGADEVAAELARLQGAAAATLLPSTLHLFWDLLRLLARSSRSALLLDAGAYPILHWAAEGAAAVGARVWRFAHHDAAALARSRATPCATGCGRSSSATAFAPVATAPRRCAPTRASPPHSDGTLVLDDTQALGVLGRAPCAACPYGHGGGGSLRWHGLAGARIAVGASLAKGFGAPLAALSGSARPDRALRARQQRRVCTAARRRWRRCRPRRRALDGNAQTGRTGARACCAWCGACAPSLVRAGLDAVGTLPFPVQSFVSRHAPGAAALAAGAASGRPAACARC